MAPEIMSGEKYGPEVDLWALGGIVYFMLNGSLHTGRRQGDRLLQFVKESKSFELQDTNSKRFSDASKDFVKSLLTSDTTKRIRFEDLSIHPFLRPSFHYTIAVNIPRGFPIMYSSPIDMSKLKMNPIKWSDVTNYIHSTLSMWSAIPPKPQFVTIVNGELVDINAKVSTVSMETSTVNIYMFIGNSMPQPFDPRLNTMKDFNPQEVDSHIKGKTGANAVNAEANFYKVRKENDIKTICQAGTMRAEALHFAGQLDKCCQGYVNKYLIENVRVANRCLMERGIQGSLPLIETGGTEEALKEQGTQDMSFMDAMQKDSEMIDMLCKDICACNPRDQRIQSVFYRFRNIHLRALRAATLREMNNYTKSWDTVARLVGALRTILTLKDRTINIRDAKTKEEMMGAFNSYNGTYNRLMFDNPTWKQKSLEEINMKADDQQAKVLALQEKLKEAEARIKELEKENENLRVSLKNAEDMLSMTQVTRF